MVLCSFLNTISWVHQKKKRKKENENSPQSKSKIVLAFVEYLCGFIKIGQIVENKNKRVSLWLNKKSTIILMERIVSVKKKKFSYDVMTLWIYCVIYSPVHPLAIQQPHRYEFSWMCVLFHFSLCKMSTYISALHTRANAQPIFVGLFQCCDCTVTVLCLTLLFSH